MCLDCEDGILQRNTHYTFGIDVSHYQGKINWDDLKQSQHPISFIIIRSSMGKNGSDSQFNRNWHHAKSGGYIRGAYHYYRPNENSTAQFEQFKSIVTLLPGDLPPVLDVEKASVFGKDNLRKGVKNWLKLAEEHYGVRPILYSGLDFYKNHLKGHVEGYPLWIAAYSGKSKVQQLPWTIHQFSEKVQVKGIQGFVDGNDYNGSIEELQALLIDPTR